MRLLRLLLLIITCVIGAGFAASAAPPTMAAKGDKDSQLQVTADGSLEYYQDKKLYVARGGAKAVRGTLTVTADVLMAHERDKTAKPVNNDKNGGGSIDLMTADGHVVVTDPRQKITGDHAVYDLDKHQMVVTGNNLRYETAKEVVTARDSLEYYEDTKLAVARGHAVADQPDRHIEGDILTAEFRDAPNGQSQLTKMTSQGHVTVITKSKESPDGKNKPKGGDVSRGNRAVYNADSNVAVLSGDVRVTRKDGTQLSGDVGEVDFNNNQSRLLNDGKGRVRALLAPTTTDKANGAGAPAP